MKKLLAHPVTPADVTAALNRIAAVADQDDVNMVRAELARLMRALDAGEDDDAFTLSLNEYIYSLYPLQPSRTSYPGTTREPD